MAKPLLAVEAVTREPTIAQHFERASVFLTFFFDPKFTLKFFTAGPAPRRPFFPFLAPFGILLVLFALLLSM